MSGFEAFGAIQAAISLVKVTGKIIEHIHTARSMSKENAARCDAVNRQLVVVKSYAEGMQHTEPQYPDAKGGIWRGAQVRLAEDMDEISTRLEKMIPLSHSRIQKAVTAVWTAKQVSAALDYVEVKVDVAWCRLQGLDSHRQMARNAERIEARFDRIESQITQGLCNTRELPRSRAGCDEGVTMSNSYPRKTYQGGLETHFEFGPTHGIGESSAQDNGERVHKANESFQKAEDGGNIYKAFESGDKFETYFKFGPASDTSESVAQDSGFRSPKANELYQQAEYGGDLDAAFKLGNLYRDGDGVAQNSPKACKLYQRAVDGGHVGAAFNLGNMYKHGDGVAQSSHKACELYQRAVDGGDLDAAVNLGNMCRDGDGVTQDSVRACQLYEHAMHGGDLDAVVNLGHMYRHGDGVRKDITKARGLYEHAADRGHRGAAEKLSQLGKYQSKGRSRKRLSRR